MDVMAAAEDQGPPDQIFGYLQDEPNNKIVYVKKEITVIGREAGCDIRFNDTKVSRKHCRLIVTKCDRELKVQIFPEKESCKLFVDDNAVSANGHCLKDGSIIRIMSAVWKWRTITSSDAISVTTTKTTNTPEKTKTPRTALTPLDISKQAQINTSVFAELDVSKNSTNENLCESLTTVSKFNEKQSLQCPNKSKPMLKDSPALIEFSIFDISTNLSVDTPTEQNQMEGKPIQVGTQRRMTTNSMLTMNTPDTNKTPKIAPASCDVPKQNRVSEMNVSTNSVDEDQSLQSPNQSKLGDSVEFSVVYSPSSDLNVETPKQNQMEGKSVEVGTPSRLIRSSIMTMNTPDTKKTAKIALTPLDISKQVQTNEVDVSTNALVETQSLQSPNQSKLVDSVEFYFVHSPSSDLKVETPKQNRREEQDKPMEVGTPTRLSEIKSFDRTRNSIFKTPDKRVTAPGCNSASATFGSEYGSFERELDITDPSDESLVSVTDTDQSSCVEEGMYSDSAPSADTSDTSEDTSQASRSPGDIQSETSNVFEHSIPLELPDETFKTCYSGEDDKSNSIIDEDYEPCVIEEVRGGRSLVQEDKQDESEEEEMVKVKTPTVGMMRMEEAKMKTPKKAAVTPSFVRVETTPESTIFTERNTRSGRRPIEVGTPSRLTTLTRSSIRTMNTPDTNKTPKIALTPLDISKQGHTNEMDVSKDALVENQSLQSKLVCSVELFVVDSPSSDLKVETPKQDRMEGKSIEVGTPRRMATSSMLTMNTPDPNKTPKITPVSCDVPKQNRVSEMNLLTNSVDENQSLQSPNQSKVVDSMEFFVVDSPTSDLKVETPKQNRMDAKSIEVGTPRRMTTSSMLTLNTPDTKKTPKIALAPLDISKQAQTNEMDVSKNSLAQNQSLQSPNQSKVVDSVEFFVDDSSSSDLKVETPKQNRMEAKSIELGTPRRMATSSMLTMNTPDTKKTAKIALTPVDVSKQARANEVDVSKNSIEVGTPSRLTRSSIMTMNTPDTKKTLKIALTPLDISKQAQTFEMDISTNLVDENQSLQSPNQSKLVDSVELFVVDSPSSDLKVETPKQNRMEGKSIKVGTPRRMATSSVLTMNTLDTKKTPKISLTPLDISKQAQTIEMDISTNLVVENQSLQSPDQSKLVDSVEFFGVDSPSSDLKVETPKQNWMEGKSMKVGTPSRLTRTSIMTMNTPDTKKTPKIALTPSNVSKQARANERDVSKNSIEVGTPSRLTTGSIRTMNTPDTKKTPKIALTPLDISKQAQTNEMDVSKNSIEVGTPSRLTRSSIMTMNTPDTKKTAKIALTPLDVSKQARGNEMDVSKNSIDEKQSLHSPCNLNVEPEESEVEHPKKSKRQLRLRGRINTNQDEQELIKAAETPRPIRKKRGAAVEEEQIEFEEVKVPIRIIRKGRTKAAANEPPVIEKVEKGSRSTRARSRVQEDEEVESEESEMEEKVKVKTPKVVTKRMKETKVPKKAIVAPIVVPAKIETKPLLPAERKTRSGRRLAHVESQPPKEVVVPTKVVKGRKRNVEEVGPEHPEVEQKKQPRVRGRINSSEGGQEPSKVPETPRSTRTSRGVAVEEPMEIGEAKVPIRKGRAKATANEPHVIEKVEKGSRSTRARSRVQEAEEVQSEKSEREEKVKVKSPKVVMKRMVETKVPKKTMVAPHVVPVENETKPERKTRSGRRLANVEPQPVDEVFESKKVVNRRKRNVEPEESEVEQMRPTKKQPRGRSKSGLNEQPKEIKAVETPKSTRKKRGVTVDEEPIEMEEVKVPIRKGRSKITVNDPPIIEKTRKGRSKAHKN